MHIDKFWRDEYEDVVALLRANGWSDDVIPSRSVVLEGLAWTVTDDDELAGYVRVITDNLLVTYVCEIVVDQRFRGRGVGRMMLDHVARKLPQTRIDLLSTLGARAFYEATGFTAKPGYRRYS